MINIEQLEEASEKLLEFHQANCNIHQSIVVDCYGVKVVSDEVFVPKKQPADNDRLSDLHLEHISLLKDASTKQHVGSDSSL